MKFKTSFSALVLALALAGVTLAGCTPRGGGKTSESESESETLEKFFVTYPASDEYTITGLDSEGYVRGTTVNFGVTLTHPDDKSIRQVTATAGTQNVTVNATATGYSLVMPEHDVRLNIALNTIERYSLEYTGTANVDETITLNLKLGNAPVSEDYEIAGKTAEDQAKIRVNRYKVTLLAQGALTLVAKINNEVKAELALNVGQSAVIPILQALNEAIVEAPFNGSGGQAAAMSSPKTVAGQILAVTSMNNGAVQAILDDGTAAVVIQVAKNENDPDPVSVGDKIRVTTVFENYYGLMEGIGATAVSGTRAPNIPAEDIIESSREFTPTITAATNMSAAQYVEYYNECAVNGVATDKLPEGSEDTRTWSKLKYVNIEVTFDKEDDASILFNIDGAMVSETKNNVTTEYQAQIDAKATHDEEMLDRVPGHKSTLTAFLLGINSSKHKSNAAVITQTALAVEEVSITGSDTALNLYKNNKRQLAFTTLPAGSYGAESWVSSDPTVATVSDKGLVRGIEGGEADITLTINGHSDSIHVVVDGTFIPATAVELNKASETITVKDTLQLTATTTPATVTEEAEWTSSAPAVATVSEEGLVTAVSRGTATITVRYNENVSASCAITVNPIHGTVEDDPLSVEEAVTIAKAIPGAANNQEVLSEEVYYVQGTLTSGSYDTSHSNFSGFMGAVELYRVTAQDGESIQVNATIIVKGKLVNYSKGYKTQLKGGANYGNGDIVKYLNISSLSISTNVGAAAVQLTASGNFATTYAWASSNPAVATVSATGLVSFVGVGSAVISVTSGAGVASCSVVVLNANQHQVVARYTNSTTTTNMAADSNNAASIGLDATIFDVRSDKKDASNQVGLNKDGTIRLYGKDGNGGELSITITGGTIDYISVDVKSGADYLAVKVGANTVTAADGAYTINSTSFILKDVVPSGTTQVQINSITIVYSTNA